MLLMQCIYMSHRKGGLPSTLQQRRDMRMLWSSCLRRRLTQNCKQRSLVCGLDEVFVQCILGVKIEWTMK